MQYLYIALLGLATTGQFISVFLLCACIGVSTSSFSQLPTLGFQRVAHRSIGTAQGLPSATVYSLLQDEEGWIWVGSGAGLYKYDGVSFVKYASSFARQSDAHELKLGPDGRIYAQNFRGQLFCVSGDSLQLVGDFAGLHSQFTSYGFIGRELIVATDEAILYFDLDEHEWPADPTHPTRTSSTINSPTIRSIGHVGAFIQSKGTNRLQTFGQLESFKNDSIASILSTLDQGDSTWVVSAFDDLSKPTRQNEINDSKGADSVHLELFCFRKSGKQGDACKLILPSGFTKRGQLYAQGLPDGRLLVAGVRGLLLIEKSTIGEAGYTSIIDGKAVNALLVDRRGNVWVGTENQGLVLIPNLSVRQQDYPRIHAPIVDLAVTADQQELFGVTFDGSIYRLQPSFERLSYEGTNSKFWQAHSGELFVSNVEIYPSRDKYFSTGLRELHISVKDGILLENGQLLIANNARLELRDIFGKEKFESNFYLGKDIQNQSLELRGRRATGIAKDSANQRLYIAYNDSLLTYSSIESPPRQIVSPISDLAIGGLAKSLALEKEQLFVGLASKGLSVVNLSTLRIDHYLEEYAVERIRCTNKQVYVETSSGVLRADIEQTPLQFELLTTHLGLPSGHPTAFFADHKFAYAAYDRRVVRIRSDQHAIRIQKQSIVFTKTEQNGVALNDPNEQPFRIEANRESLRFEPRIADYSQAPETAFEYRLSDTDTSWQQASGERASIFLNSLSPGNHSLEIRLAGEPETQSIFKIIAKVPFWRKPWPYVAFISLIAIGIIATIRRRAKQNQRFAERETALRESQLTALAAQMNPHFIFNALNSVQDFMMRNDRLAANDYLTKFARLIRLTLEHSRVPEISLSQELDMMRTYLDLERIRFDDEIEIELIEDASLPLAAKLPALLIQPYVENAFKHGLLHREGDRRLLVRYEIAKGGVLVVTIEDNGVGRQYAGLVNNRNRTGKRFATGATARRVALLNAGNPGRYSVIVEDLVTNNYAVGTRVKLRIRLNDHSLKLTPSIQKYEDS